jgi:hypothetical protein
LSGLWDSAEDSLETAQKGLTGPVI